eukprot:TRINITY_DN1881_c0_g1_i3.p2 TRINITY_DN1881_c0_g1~~TRINITY_DN1881_c0_g1_i3.p2  ORF type:complete len:123 (+),score=14.64 TRINITY_DN1881_c0_g1_i3:45-413(+)
MAAFGYVFGLCDHPKATEQAQPAIKAFGAHISPTMHMWSRSGHTLDIDLSNIPHDGFLERRKWEIENAPGPCVMDEFHDVQCRIHPQNKFAAKMTEARPGEYCDAWTLPRLEMCRKVYGLEA